MSDKMPESMDEEAVAEFVYETARTTFNDTEHARTPWSRLGTAGRGEARNVARAVLALVEAKVREAVRETKDSTDPRCDCDNSGTGGRIHIGFDDTDAIVARVLGRDGGAR